MSDMEADVEGLDFEAIFGALTKKTGKSYACADERDRRLKAERKAGLSRKQRAQLSEPRRRLRELRFVDG